MSNFRYKITIYLPLLFAIVLMGGILLGIRLAPRQTNRGNIFSVDLSKYSKVSDVLGYIMRDWVDTVNLESLEDDAIIQILENLDPHSQYIPASEFNEVNEHLEGNFEGIGVQFRIEKDTAMVIIPIAGGPSEKVGIKAGDRIVIVDGDTIAGVNTNNQEVMKRLKGPKNTKVNVKIFRRGEAELLDFTITRGVIPTYSLDIAYMVDETIGYVKLNKFSATTYEEFTNALTDLKREGMNKLILDLRNNSGGYLQAAISVCDEFLADKQLIVYTEGKNRPRNYAYATRRGSFQNEEIVVLIDEGSASASEIVAGAIQDNDRGTIIGRRSFGKGLVQEQVNLMDGSAIRLTTARYYTPTGRSIQKPYENGREDYYKEFHKRFENGEVFHADSIHFDDTLKFITPGGKVVYGGGGIMPDIFIPIETGDHMAYYNRLINRGIIYDFAFEYTDANRQVLSRFTDYKSFNLKFNITESIFEQLIAFAEKKELERDHEGIMAMKEDIKILLKALIGRNILDNQGFYPIFHQRDNVFNQAVKILKEGSV
ncbi:MAG: S41 family peptidase [Bacteroidales bacterium]|nr:S41 family peptidase [Bacteroidales bacterium]